MSYLFLDTETKSYAPLKECGAYRYSEDSTTDCLCVAWGIDKGVVHAGTPEQVAKIFRERPGIDTFFVARNAPFDFAIFKNVLVPKYGFHPDYADPARWICTAKLSRMHGLPASLEESANYLNKKHKKLPDGKRLITMYSIPAKNKKTGERYFRPIPPDEMARMIEYCKLDVEADREAFYTLIKLPNVEIEKAVVAQDFALNVRGIKIDVEGLHHLVEVIEKATARAMTDQRKYNVTWKDKNGAEYTDALNVRSVPKLKAWLMSKGFDVPDTRVDTLEEIYENTADAEVKEVLSFRFFLAKASLKKYRAAVNRVSPDGRLRYFLKYYGAHTGRFAGEGFQVHNLPKSKWEKGVKPDIEIGKLIKTISDDTPYVELVELGKKILPGLMIPDAGYSFLSGDFSAIEPRGIAWLCGCRKMLADFAEDDRTGDKTNDLYSRTAKRIDPRGVRQFGKVMVLAPIYGMGAEKAQATAEKWGCPVSFAMAEKGIQYIRTTYEEIPRFWYALEEAFRATWLSKQPHNVGKYIRFERGGNYIKIVLPSGRSLFYHQVKIEDGQLSYANFGKKGARMKLWGGTLAENITQATCRDILTDRMLALDAAGLPVQLHVHDENVSEVLTKEVKAKQKIFDKIMNTAPAWAKGFPLKTESEITARYHK